MSTITVADLQHLSNSNNSVTIASDSSVALKHSGNEKIATTATGVNITGACAATSFSGDGSALTGISLSDATKMPLTGGTFTGSVTFENAINETEYINSSSTNVTLDPDNGMLQWWNVQHNATVTDGFNDGQSMLLRMVDTSGSHTVTWPTMVWIGGTPPTLPATGNVIVELFKPSGTLFGAIVGTT